MKGFLFDENIPADFSFQPSLPIFSFRDVGLNPSDSAIWEYARRNELSVVTKDSDFYDRIIIRVPPPWVVHLRFGNLRLKEYRSVVTRFWPEIEKLLKSHKLVNVYSDRLEAIG